ADRLGADALRAIAGREDAAGLVDADIAGRIAVAAEPADGDAGVDGLALAGAVEADDAAEAAAAGAAAAADRLREDADRFVAGGADQAVTGDVDVAAPTAVAAEAADGHAEVEIGFLAAEPDDRSRRKAAIAAAAANRLRQDCVGFGAAGGD